MDKKSTEHLMVCDLLDQLLHHGRTFDRDIIAKCYGQFGLRALERALIEMKTE